MFLGTKIHLDTIFRFLLFFLEVTLYCYYFLKYLFIYLAAWDLSCGPWDLSLWPMGSSLRCGVCAGFSLVAAHGLSSCGTRV